MINIYKPYGVTVAMIIPMNADESIDETVLLGQTECFVKSKIHGLFCIGTNGGFQYLSRGEKLHVIRIVMKQAVDRKPVCAGVGCVTMNTPTWY